MPGALYKATAGRLFAAAYDRMLGPTERAGLTATRRELLAGAGGAVLEVGAGTGLNLEHYPAAVTELVLAEPGEHMARQLRARVARSGRTATVVQAPGERLPFEDGSFDTAVLTLVLCTAPEPPRVLREIARVLKPGGRFLFLEHVRSDAPRLGRWQDRVNPVWPYLADGCNCNRRTLETIESSPLKVARLESGRLAGAPPFVRPLIFGEAELAGDGS